MKELRVTSGSLVIRIAFAFDPARQAILLAGGMKQGVNQQRFYRKLIQIADALFDMHLEHIRKTQRKNTGRDHG